MGLSIVTILKIVAALAALAVIVFAIRGYGKLRERQGRENGIDEATEVANENFKGLADDVLDGPHPYRVRDKRAAEITGTDTEPEGRVAPDTQRKG